MVGPRHRRRPGRECQTIIGASANVILVSMAEREGHPITFGTFLMYAAPVTLGTIVVSTAYIWLRYLT